MLNSHDSPPVFQTSESLYPAKAATLRQGMAITQIVGVIAAVVRHGLRPDPQNAHLELAMLAVLSAFVLIWGRVQLYRWSLTPRTFWKQHRAEIALCAALLASALAILLFWPFLATLPAMPKHRGYAFILCAEIFLVLRGLTGIVVISQRAAAGRFNPALLLVLSFLFLIAIGTVLLMLPRARSELAPRNEPFEERLWIALFTSSSASCVTGLSIVNIGGEQPYWSRLGQTIILCLFQIGGLGIMTWGAFFAAAVGRQMQLREGVNLSDMLESESPANVRRLLKSIVLFTLIAEILGAVLLSGLWADLPWKERIYQSVFHSVSAFCNAGVSLTPNSFVGMGGRWQVWLVVPTLVILGGLGFAVLYNVTLVARSRFSGLRQKPLFNLPRQRVRLTVSSRLVLLTTACLLVGGAVGVFVLEGTGRPDLEPIATRRHQTAASPRGELPVTAEDLEDDPESDLPVVAPTPPAPLSSRIANAWFQSAIFRTAGFSTIDYSEMQPATKLFAIPLMLIGASPGSTGGGIKTICFALTVLAILSVLSGRERVEVMGRTIPHIQVSRALAILTLGVVVTMGATILLVLFEQQPQRLLDHLFEAAGAFSTTGASTGVIAELTRPSQVVIVVTMFVGRVGPLTLLIGLGGRAADARYDYPLERVALG